MISKIRSFQDSWLVKGILVLTALSFMSLFGISGYLSRSGGRQPIIRVDDLIVTQDEINNQLNDQLQTTRNFLGEDTEISDSMRTAMLQEIVQRDLERAILSKTAADNSVVISDELIRKIIYSQPEFMDASGQFDLAKMRRMLNITGWSEKKYVDSLRADIIRQHLTQLPARGLIVPHAMDAYLTQLENQRTVFEYVVIEPAKLKVDRQISDDEIDQYYQDFALQFEESENRDVSFIELPIDLLAQKYSPSEEDIAAYYQDNLERYVTPENRHVLQMVFDDQATADKAEAALNAGGDFYKVAADIAKQDKATTDLGEVSQDMLIADMSEAVFALKKGQHTLPVKSDMGWHIMKVVDITPKKETKLAAVKNQIAEEIRKEQAYEQAAEAVAGIEDKLGAGAGLDDIATEYKVKVNTVSGLREDGSYAKADAAGKAMAALSDFVDTAYSYNTGEISQVIETDNGFALLRVDAINDAHIKDLAAVRGEIEKLWLENEKSAIAQEIVNDVTHDLENGDKFADVARRFNLNLQTTKPLKRGQSFAGLTMTQLKEMYLERVGQPKVFASDERIVIALPEKIIRSSHSPEEASVDAVRATAAQNMALELEDELVEAYGSDYKVRVKYKYLGLGD